MRTQITWADKLPEVDGAKLSINDIAFRPDGAQIICAAGTRILVYDAAVGDKVMPPLKGHKDTVYCLTYSSDGKRFASGGADKQVIIWTSKGDGILKFQHNDSIQAVAYNPVTHQLASITATDFGLWHAEQKNVGKNKLPGKGLCCAWTPDGQHLAIGLFNGFVTIRARTGEEKTYIRRNAPIWTLSFSPSREEGVDVLAVGSWDQRLSFYSLSGKQLGKDKELKFDPTCVSYFSNGEYLLVSGSDRTAGLYTKDGTFLVKICDLGDWVWAVRARPKQLAVATCTNDGQVSLHQLMFSTVHSIYQENYVYRDSMTNVVIQQLAAEKKLTIQCKDYVKKVAIYRDRLAVQLSDRVVIYELFQDDQFELRYKEREKIKKNLDCSLLCVTSSNLVLCQDKRLTSYDFFGQKRKEWVMDSVIRYIKVVGGLAEREALLVGLKNGGVFKIFVDNAFPISLVKLNVPIRCLDLSSSRTKLAVVDENAQCQVYDLITKELLFQEANANAVAWNTDHEDMLCYSGNGMLNIKTGVLPPYQQRLQGFVVGFKSNKVFCLHYSSMTTVDVPHSHALYRYIERKEFAKAYQIACLGITEADWKMLGMHAMTHLALDVARKSFVRIRDVKFVELLNRIELDRRTSGGNEGLLLGDILAFQGKYMEAAKCFIKAGFEEKAIEMFCDMKMWDEAHKVCTQEDHLRDLIRRQARWAEDTGDRKDAAKQYLAAGDIAKAIALMGAESMIMELVDVMRTLPKSDVANITECGNTFRKLGSLQYAAEAFERIADSKQLLQIHVEMQMWDAAFALLTRYPQYAGDVYVPYAAWLATNDRYEEAQEAFKKAKRPQEALRMMEQLAGNNVLTRRFSDAGFYFFKLTQECGAKAEGQVRLEGEELLNRQMKYHTYMRKAELYYVYSMIYKYVNQPFTSLQPITLFNAGKYLFGVLSENAEVPFNISKLDVLLALARLAEALSMFKTSRLVHDKLQQYVLPNAQLMDQLDLAILVMRGRPFQDREDLQQMCFRCGQTNTALPGPGDRCNHCLHPFIRSFHSFEVLPLVEFVLADGLSDSEALHVIATGKKNQMQARMMEELQNGKSPDAGSGSVAANGADVMTLNDELIDAAMNQGSSGGGGDPFARQLMQLELNGRDKNYRPIVCTADMLRMLKKEDILVVRPARDTLGLPYRYFRNMVPAITITQCTGCQHFFHDEDYEYEVLRSGGCPFCKRKFGEQPPAVEELTSPSKHH
jgi:intraflagellar transport protein 122